jgi:hypothetical protein
LHSAEGAGRLPAQHCALNVAPAISHYVWVELGRKKRSTLTDTAAQRHSDIFCRSTVRETVPVVLAALTFSS